MEEIFSILRDILLGYWWIITPIVLFFILRAIWLNHIQSEFIKNIKWILLEVNFPRETTKSPKTMEQFFSGLHAVQRRLKFKDKYLKGEIPTWFSVEIVGQQGDIHFFIRTQSKYRDLIESQVYAQYPDAEIFEADDYIADLPKDIPNKEYDVWGTELLLNKEDAYPIRTYPVFFEEKEAEERTDPIASLFEFLSNLGLQEHVWIQILISPVDDSWKKQGEKIVAKMLGRKEKKSKESILIEETGNWIKAFFDGIIEFITGIFGSAEESKAGEEGDKAINLSPGEKEVVLAIERNIAKLGFKTIIRELYWAKKDGFSKDKTAAIGGFFTQFNTQNLNGFKPNKKITPGWAKVLKKRREVNQKKYIVEIYKKRYFPFRSFSDRGFIFNTEELATIFHIPIKFVKVEKMPRIEAKKGGPPSGLPII